MLKRASLNYQIPCTGYLQKVRHLGQAVLLDSGFPSCKRGRYDIISAAPIATITSHKGALSGINLPFSLDDVHDPFEAVALLQDSAKKQLQSLNFSFDASKIAEPVADSDLASPFCGGLLGHFSYDLGRSIEQLPQIAVDDSNLPEMHLGLYAWAIIIDHKLQLCYLAGSDLINELDFLALESLLNAPLTAVLEPFKLSSAFKSNLDREDYTDALEKIDDYILSGDCYQVNFAQRFSATCEGDPLSAYKKLRDAAPTHFSAFIDTQQGAILSLSPERFLSVD
ncbi:MAG: para-aminobenzoate synthetase component 1, partial [Oceanospirillaceae bacterium]